MPNLSTFELKVFLPASDFETSKRFYHDLGFTIEALGDDLAVLSHGRAKFLLQKYDVKAFAESLQMHLLVEDVESWYLRTTEVAAKYGTRSGAPTTQPWGIRDFSFIDPAGVCWRVGQEIGQALDSGFRRNDEQS